MSMLSEFEIESASRETLRSHSLRLCPNCSHATLSRERLQFYLRPLRRLGVELNAYTCGTCHRKVILSRNR